MRKAFKPHILLRHAGRGQRMVTGWYLLDVHPRPHSLSVELTCKLQQHVRVQHFGVVINASMLSLEAFLQIIAAYIFAALVLRDLNTIIYDINVARVCSLNLFRTYCSRFNLLLINEAPGHGHSHVRRVVNITALMTPHCGRCSYCALRHCFRRQKWHNSNREPQVFHTATRTPR